MAKRNQVRGTSNVPARRRDPQDIARSLQKTVDEMATDLIDGLYQLYKGESAEYRRAMRHAIQGDIARLITNLYQKAEGE